MQVPQSRVFSQSCFQLALPSSDSFWPALESFYMLLLGTPGLCYIFLLIKKNIFFLLNTAQEEKCFVGNRGGELVAISSALRGKFRRKAEHLNCFRNGGTNKLIVKQILNNTDVPIIPAQILLWSFSKYFSRCLTRLVVPLLRI